MAISLIKRYKNEIDYIMSRLTFDFSNVGYCSIMVCRSFSVPGTSNLSFSHGREYTTSIAESIDTNTIDFKKHVKIIEQRNLIYIGINLEDIKFENLKRFSNFYLGYKFFERGLDDIDSYSMGIFYYNFLSNVVLTNDKDMEFLKYRLPENDFPELYNLIKLILDDGDNRIDPNYSSHYEKFLKILTDYIKSGRLDKVYLFKEIRRNISNSLSKPFKVGLYSDCYKTLKDRQILPYVVYSPSEGLVKYKYSYSSYSEKKNVVKYDIDSLKNRDNAYAPWGLVERLED